MLTMSTSEMVSRLSTWTSTPTGIGGPGKKCLKNVIFLHKSCSLFDYACERGQSGKHDHDWDCLNLVLLRFEHSKAHKHRAAAAAAARATTVTIWLGFFFWPISALLLCIVIVSQQHTKYNQVRIMDQSWCGGGWNPAFFQLRCGWRYKKRTAGSSEELGVFSAADCRVINSDLIKTAHVVKSHGWYFFFFQLNTAFTFVVICLKIQIKDKGSKKKRFIITLLWNKSHVWFYLSIILESKKLTSNPSNIQWGKRRVLTLVM